MFAPFMMNAWITATIVAVVAGVVGYFVVLRGSAFPAHAIPKGAFAGAAGASLLGVSTLAGMAVFSLLSAVGIGVLGTGTPGRRGRHDVATALALVVGLALGAAFLSQTSEYEPEIYSLLFGEVLGVSSAQIPLVAALAAVCVLVTAILYRPLMLSSVVPEIAEAAGISARRMEIAFLLVVALATTVTVPVVGALLIFSLMIGPPAAARSLTSRPAVAMVLSVIIAVVTVWAAIAASYLYNWPIGFFVGAFGALSYGVGRAWAARRRSVTTDPRLQGFAHEGPCSRREADSAHL
jgi:zinc/manganese transport system permease protein